jgi:2-oxoglutarate ferredoxin oxidoreductase subunit gamma
MAPGTLNGDERYEIRMAGLGGQGLLLAGLILGEALSVCEGYRVAGTQAYAPLARGAPSKSELVVSKEDIDFPKVECPDLLLLMARESYHLYGRKTKPSTVVILDSSEILHDNSPDAVRIPLSDMAEEATGKKFTASILALGVISTMLEIVKPESLTEVLRRRAPRGTFDINLKALERGFAEGRNLR